MLPPRSTVSLFSQNPTTRALVRTVCATRGWNYVEAASLVEVVEEGLVVLDQKHIDQAMLNQLRNSPARRSMTIVVLARDLESPLVGADLVVDAACVNDFVQMLTRDISPRLVVNYDRLLAVSLITHERASTQVTEDIAGAFGVAKCMLSMRGTSGDASMAHGDTIEAGMVAPARVRQCLAWRAPLVASERAFSSTTIAVPVELAQGQGYLALIADRVCLPAAEQMRLLETLSTRLAVEHGVRTAYERTSAELDRVSTGPGLDSLLPIWNRAALLELAAMVTSSSRRANVPLAVCVLDVVDLRLTNTRHGLEVGDRLLHRIADTMRTSLRQEDILGRWSGDELAILLPSTNADGAQRVAQRVITRLAARQLSAGNTPIPIHATFGIAMVEDNEEPAAALSRAARAALDTQRSDGQILLDRPQEDGPAPRISRQLDAAREDLGTIIGGSFRLLHEISRGGMGVVYRAEDLALERPVAIKMIRPDVAEDREVLERLRTEATMLARLQHPNLVQIYSFGQHGGDSYLVMELVEGESLDQAFERHRLEGSSTVITDIVQMVEQVASALDLLHDRGIVHRDVKPANVIFDPFRVRSVLVDVGIATVRGQHQHVAGTPGFIAPEVLQGAVANGQSDVYALAATAYALLTLTLPWGTGNAVSIVTRQVSEKLQPPSAIRAELAPFDDVITSAMSLDPSERPATAGELARGLRAAAKRFSSAARAPTETAAEGAVPSTTSDAPSGAQRTRGVVFRSVNRALGLRDAAKLREQLRTDSPELAQALSDAAPLAWLPSARFTELLTRVPALLNREPRAIARDLARATVRASFRRFFPTSAATLVPERTLFAIRNVWARYQAWGQIQSMPVAPMEVVVRLAHGLYEPLACEWTCGLIEQLLVLSGAGMPVVVHEQCECNGADSCVFRATWTALEGEPSEHQGVE